MRNFMRLLSLFRAQVVWLLLGLSLALLALLSQLLLMSSAGQSLLLGGALLSGYAPAVWPAPCCAILSG